MQSHQNDSATDELKIQEIMNILEPAVITRDGKRIGAGIVESHAKYGTDILKAAWIRLTREHDYLIGLALAAAPTEEREEVEARACDIIASKITEAGLRIEDHLRVSERGVVLSREAIAALADTDPFPSLAEFGEGLPSLTDVGISRDPYVHDLCEVDKDSSLMNSWGIVTVLLNTAMGWLQDEPLSNRAMAGLKDIVTSTSPTLAFELLIDRARYDDRALLKLVSLANEGLNARCDQSFNL